MTVDPTTQVGPPLRVAPAWAGHAAHDAPCRFGVPARHRGMLPDRQSRVSQTRLGERLRAGKPARGHPAGVLERRGATVRRVDPAARKVLRSAGAGRLVAGDGPVATRTDDDVFGRLSGRRLVAGVGPVAARAADDVFGRLAGPGQDRLGELPGRTARL